ncbi:hypothetical protein B0I37DRAFT_433142 [Chaetomium sp. MPI-CAGE-AT-0009]|nr:hypothetical protein B0I37DRAFT_433142 [Chaetomium sp. MPI-CAGE-AT-0009]
MDPIQAITTELGMDKTGIKPDDSSATSATPPAANLEALPFDILRLIVWDEVLSQDDVASLRLTCCGLVLSTTTRLFYRIGISKLKVDRESFLSICHNPDLAKHVHEVEWWEVSWDARYFDRIPGFSTRSDAEDDADLADLAVIFRAKRKKRFGCPTREREEAVGDFRERFMAAVDQLPSLHTFISRPMTSTRIINPGSDYPMDVSLFQTFHNMDGSWRTTSRANDGLFLFIFPAMARSSSAVNRLRWADEFPGYSYLRPIPSSAFEGLESLDLCWTPFNPDGEIDKPSLATACSIAAPTLRRLSLCLDHGAPQTSPGYVEREILGPNLAASKMGALQSLRLVSMNLEPDVLPDIIAANATCLRHIHLENVDASIEILRRMPKLTGLRLTTMEVLDEHESHQTESLCAYALVRYLNGKRSIRGFHRPCLGDVRRKVDFNDDQSYRFHTVELCGWGRYKYDHDYESECDVQSGVQSDAASDASQDSLDTRRANGPKWIWARYYHRTKTTWWGDVYVLQVPNTDPDGHPTRIWRFTSRNGEVAYGDDPLNWFDEWDPTAGDVEEPTHYCSELRAFARRTKGGDLADLLGKGSPLLKSVLNEKPPWGAIPYDADLDPLVTKEEE